MPIIKSAKKRVRQSEKRTIRNVKTKRSLREALKGFSQALTSGKADTISAAQKKADSALDTAAKKNVIHKNKAARRKSQLSSRAKKALATPAAPAKKAASITTVKKAPATKPSVKKTAVKKTAVKKAAPKKTAKS